MTRPWARAMADRRWLALVVLCVGQLMIVLDATVVNVALPAIQSDLGFSQASLAWVINGYLITFGGLLLLAGRLGDLLGRRRMLLAGLGLFTVASLFCGLSTSQALLVIARFVQGVGAAVVASMVLALIVTLFPQPRETARAMTIYAFVASSGGSIGLLLGGLLTEAVSWHWIFFINLPIGIVALALASTLLPRDRGMGLHHGVDVAGGVLVTAAPSLAVYTILQGEGSGWLSMRTLALAAGTLALGIAFLVRESTARTPLVPLRILRSRQLVAANLLRALFAVGLFGTYFLGVLYMQDVLGYSSLKTGIAFLPQTVGVAVMSLFVTRRMVARFGNRTVIVGALALVVAGLALFARTPVDGAYLTTILPVTVMVGTGAGLIFAPSATLAMSGVAPREVGLASGLANVALQLGAAAGVAVLASVSSARTAVLLSTHSSTASALTAGYHLGFLVAAGSVLLALVLTAVLLREPHQAPLPAPADPARAARPLPEMVVIATHDARDGADLVGAAAD